MKTRTPRRRQRGFTLFDGVVALGLLAFGLLAMVRFQTKLVGQASETQQRMTATQFADELLNTMLIDAGNANCYTLPQTGACGSVDALARATSWKTRTLAALPGAPTATSTIDAATNRMTVTLTWYFKDSSDVRKHEVISDIRSN